MGLFKLVTVPIVLSLTLTVVYITSHEMQAQRRHHLYFHLFLCSKCVQYTFSCCTNMSIFGVCVTGAGKSRRYTIVDFGVGLCEQELTIKWSSALEILFIKILSWKWMSADFIWNNERYPFKIILVTWILWGSIHSKTSFLWQPYNLPQTPPPAMMSHVKRGA